VLTLIIVTLLASMAFRRVALTKGYAANRIQFYPLVIVAAVLVPSFCAGLFLGFAESHGLCSETTRAASLLGVDILSFFVYFSVLGRYTMRLKNLPNLAKHQPPPPSSAPIPDHDRP
jgi:hypothetical protein